MEWTEDQLVIKDGKEYIRSPKGNLVLRSKWENLQGPFTGPDDPRIKNAHTPEVNSQRGRTNRRRRTIKETVAKQLQLLADEDKEFKDLEDMEYFKELDTYNKTNVDALVKTLIEEGRKGNTKATEILFKVGGGFNEEITVNVNNEAQSTMSLLNAKLKDRAADLYEDEEDIKNEDDKN